jgi:flagellar FliL protein
MAEDDSNQEDKKGGGIKRILVFALGALLMIGIGFGAGYFMFAMGEKTPAEEIELIIENKLKESGQLPTEEEGIEEVPQRVSKEVPETTTFVTTYYEFPDKFTTNLLDSRKFLQMGLSVSTQYDASVIENVEMHTQALRSEILTIMGEFSEESIQGKAGRDALSKRIKEAINLKLDELEGFGGIEGVYFSSFVLQ